MKPGIVQAMGDAASDNDKVNILLVDDQPARLLSYESILGSLGQHLISVRSGNEALQQVLTTELAVILLDVSMPGMDGFETAALIHNHPRYQHIPIIFVTGIHVNDLDRLKGYQLGAVDYVSIPIVPEILRSKVAVLVELHCQRKKLQELNASLAAANARLEMDNTALQAEKTRELEVLNQHLSEANKELAKANQALLVENQERMRVESALKEADRHKDEFLAILAHELRNPLAPIRHAVDIMSNIDLDNKAFIWSREVIGRQATHLTRLVEDLLDVSRITHGTIRLHKEVVTVQSIIDRAIEALTPVIRNHNHELQVDCTDPSITVYGDPVRLVQVLGNLLNNAAKFSPQPGVIRVVVDVKQSTVEFRIIDSGIGIAPESLSQLFTLFSQIHNANDLFQSSTRRHGDSHSEHGLGIGLALVKRLVELHDGSVSVRSAGLNAGSEFIFSLPVHGAAETIVVTHDPPLDITARSVLLVDDNADALEGLSLLMELAGHKVFKATDGLQAIKLVEKHRPEIAILDIGMPVMDGYELAQHLRAEAIGKEMHLIALSGWGQQEDMQRAYEAGFDHHLVKPATFEAISELMAKLD
jgi:signal transduction histidine kinase